MNKSNKLELLIFNESISINIIIAV